MRNPRSAKELEEELEELRRRLPAQRGTRPDVQPEARIVLRNGLKMRFWLVSGIAAVLLSAVTFYEVNWRKGVDQAVEMVPQVKVNATNISLLAIELREQRKEQLTFYAFIYQRLGAVEQAQDVRELLQRLDRRLPPATPPPTPARQ